MVLPTNATKKTPWRTATIRENKPWRLTARYPWADFVSFDLSKRSAGAWLAVRVFALALKRGTAKKSRPVAGTALSRSLDNSSVPCTAVTLFAAIPRQAKQQAADRL
jgi:hypothetical protein